MSDEETFRCAYCGRKYETRKAAKKCERADIELMMSANPNSGGGRGISVPIRGWSSGWGCDGDGRYQTEDKADHGQRDRDAIKGTAHHRIGFLRGVRATGLISRSRRTA